MRSGRNKGFLKSLARRFFLSYRLKTLVRPQLATVFSKDFLSVLPNEFHRKIKV